jgi:hypothetical protein
VVPVSVVTDVLAEANAHIKAEGKEGEVKYVQGDDSTDKEVTVH